MKIALWGKVNTAECPNQKNRVNSNKQLSDASQEPRTARTIQVQSLYKDENYKMWADINDIETKKLYQEWTEEVILWKSKQNTQNSDNITYKRKKKDKNKGS